LVSFSVHGQGSRLSVHHPKTGRQVTRPVVQSNEASRDGRDVDKCEQKQKKCNLTHGDSKSTAVDTF